MQAWYTRPTLSTTRILARFLHKIRQPKRLTSNVPHKPTNVVKAAPNHCPTTNAPHKPTDVETAAPYPES
jgi:hypothetical protein